MKPKNKSSQPAITPAGDPGVGAAYIARLVAKQLQDRPIYTSIAHAAVEALLIGHQWRWGNPAFTPLTPDASVVRLNDGRIALHRFRIVADVDIEQDRFWNRLAVAEPIGPYITAAQVAGHIVQTVLYDVSRLPGLASRRNETPETFAERLLTDIGCRPDWYFQRREYPCIAASVAA